MSDPHRPTDDPAQRPAWLQHPDLAAARLGGTLLWANDDFFAEKENLLKPEAPVWREHEYTDRGKWMDGWESRRRRTPGHDSCIVELGLPGVLRGVVVDTAFFRGNYPEHCSLEACAADGSPSLDELQGASTEWVEVLPKSALRGDSQNLFTIDSPYRFTHLRFHIYPDGGVARLRVHGEVVPDWPAILAAAASNEGEVDLVAVEHGGRWLAASDMFFSAPQNLLMPGRGVRMDDGWETKRRRGPGFDWVVLRLGIAGTVRRVEVDTAHFKGNYPDSCSVEVSAAPDGASDAEWKEWGWREVLPRTKLQADAQHIFDAAEAPPATHGRINIYPDGGVSRLRLWGVPSAEGRRAEGLRRLNALLPRQAKSAFLDCCGSPAWARAMNERRPFASAGELFAAADTLWQAAGRDEWLTAFKSHPEIGERKAEQTQSSAASGWSAAEQAGTRDAGEATRDALAAANRSYRERFGHIFIVCATGKSAEEMLALCEARLANPHERELEVAAEEQCKITRLRLEKLLAL
ncbi:MAG TPA: allantoicase [Thermoanaerobaculia bacterium]|jgi:allantoicase|nr:allantoicase [Thermoanaerobaculia bacterium]